MTSLQRSLRFVLGGLMLAVMAAWINANHDPAPTVVVWLVGLTALLAFFGGFRTGDDPKAVSTSGMIAVVIGVLSVTAAVFLAWNVGNEGLGETLGLGMFSVLAFAAGLGDLAAAGPPEGGWRTYQSMRPLIGLSMAALGAIGIGMFFYLTLIQKVGGDWVPELVGALLGGFMLLFGGLYLFINSDPPPEVSALRLHLVLIGTILGMILLCVGLIRGYLWYSLIFTGSSALVGANSYRFWYTAYLVIAGIGLTTASLNLMVGQVRHGVGMRRAIYGFGAVTSTALLLVLLVFINIFVSLKHPYTYKWSEAGGLSSQVSEGTKDLLSKLNEPTAIYILMSSGNPLYNDVRNFANNMRAETSKLTVTSIDPDADPREYLKLANRFRELLPEGRGPFGSRIGRGVLIVYGDMPDDIKTPVPHQFIPEDKLEEFKPPRQKIVKVESEITKELAFLAKQGQARKIYIVQGDGALNIKENEPNARKSAAENLSKVGASSLVDKLKKDNYEVQAISFGGPPKDAGTDILYLGSVAGDKQIEIPEDCTTLVVLGPSTPLPAKGLEAMERYMDRGAKSKMIVTLDAVVTESVTLKRAGLEEFLRKYGVDATDQIVYRRPEQNQVPVFGKWTGIAELVLVHSPENPPTLLSRQFQTKAFRWWSTRVIKPGDSKKYQVQPLLVADPEEMLVWADDKLTGLTDFNEYFDGLVRTRRINDVLTRTPIPVAVTVSEGMGEVSKGRMVVFGDTEFLSNFDMKTFPVNYDLFASSIEWMSERGFVGPKAQETAKYSFGPGASLNVMVFGASWTMLIGIIAAGIGVWLMRRR